MYPKVMCVGEMKRQKGIDREVGRLTNIKEENEVEVKEEEDHDQDQGTIRIEEIEKY